MGKSTSRLTRLLHNPSSYSRWETATALFLVIPSRPSPAFFSSSVIHAHTHPFSLFIHPSPCNTHAYSQLPAEDALRSRKEFMEGTQIHAPTVVHTHTHPTSSTFDRHQLPPSAPASVLLDIITYEVLLLKFYCYHMNQSFLKLQSRTQKQETLLFVLPVFVHELCNISQLTKISHDLWSSSSFSSCLLLL